MTLRFKLPPGGDVPPVVAARRLGLSLEAFNLQIETLISRGFPPADPTTGNFDLDAIDKWSKRRGKLTGWVYFIRCGEFIKIGFSTDPRRRLADIQSHMPHDAELLLAFAASEKVERQLHRKFGAMRHRNEWFRAEQALVTHIEWIRIESREVLYDG